MSQWLLSCELLRCLAWVNVESPTLYFLEGLTKEQWADSLTLKNNSRENEEELNKLGKTSEMNIKHNETNQVSSEMP